MTTIVLDIGKTNLKLLVVDRDGTLRDQRSMGNRPLQAPPWLHPDLDAIEAWLRRGLDELAPADRATAFVAAGHGSGGVLVGDDGPVLPAVDYESEPPAALMKEYARIVPPFAERGSAILGGASHFARQLLWMQLAEPEAVATARHFLPFPQYWAWRLGGRAAVDPTMLGAQSHLWSPARGDFNRLVDRMGWRRLFPPVGPAWEELGRGPHGLRLLAGVHDSSANLYRYQRAGLGDATLLSTGTWIVGMRPGGSVDRLGERCGATVTTDVAGAPVPGVLAMTGREYAVLAEGGAARAGTEALASVVAQGTLALPGFCDFDGIYPGSAGHGRIIGPAAEPTALATLFSALVAADCLDILGSDGTVVIDGGFAGDPAFAHVLAALRPDLRVMVEPTGGGTAAGAALLADLTMPVELPLRDTEPLDLPGLADYARRWRGAVAAHLGRR